MSYEVCRRMYCNTRMAPVTDTLGRLTFICPKCDRNAHGLCRDCPNPLGPGRTRGRCMRCPTCSERSRKERNRRRSARYRKDPKLARRMSARKKVYHARPEVKARVLAWRRSRPKRAYDDLDRAYRRAYAASCRQDPKWRARYNKKRRKIAAKKRQDPAYRALFLERSRAYYRANRGKRIRDQKAIRARETPEERARRNARCCEVAAAKREAVQNGLPRSEWKRFDKQEHLLRKPYELKRRRARRAA